MKRLASSVVACSIILFSFSSAPGAQSKARVQLGSDVGLLDKEVRVGLTVDNGGEELVALQDEIVFPAALSFVAGELTEPWKEAHAKIQVEVAPPVAGASTRKLLVKILAADDSVLPNGAAALLKFKTPKKIEGDSVDLKLEHQASGTAKGGGSITPANDNGMVTVLKQPREIIGCFFYMH